MQIRRAVSGLEQQATLAAGKCSQVLRDFSGQVNLSRTGVGLEIPDNSRPVRKLVMSQIVLGYGLFVLVLNMILSG